MCSLSLNELMVSRTELVELDDSPERPERCDVVEDVPESWLSEFDELGEAIGRPPAESWLVRLDDDADEGDSKPYLPPFSRRLPVLTVESDSIPPSRASSCSSSSSARSSVSVGGAGTLSSSIAASTTAASLSRVCLTSSWTASTTCFLSPLLPFFLVLLLGGLRLSLPLCSRGLLMRLRLRCTPPSAAGGDVAICSRCSLLCSCAARKAGSAVAIHLDAVVSSSRERRRTCPPWAIWAWTYVVTTRDGRAHEYVADRQ